MITAGQSIRWNIDIDLAASNTILSTSPAEIQVQPFVVVVAGASRHDGDARARPVCHHAERAERLHHEHAPVLRSGLGARRTDGQHQCADLFQHQWRRIHRSCRGSPPLAALLESTSVVAYGTLDSLVGITPSFNATSVYAGTSQESPLAEYLTGTVCARSGDMIALRGVTYLDPQGIYAYYAETAGRDRQLDDRQRGRRCGSQPFDRLDLRRPADQRLRAGRPRLDHRRLCSTWTRPAARCACAHDPVVGHAHLGDTQAAPPWTC